MVSQLAGHPQSRAMRLLLERVRVRRTIVRMGPVDTMIDAIAERPPVFAARSLTKVYQMGEVTVEALRGIDFDIAAGWGAKFAGGRVREYGLRLPGAEIAARILAEKIEGPFGFAEG